MVENALAKKDGISDVFVFRGGIKWGMSQEEVMAFEGEPNGSTETDAFNSIYYKDVPVSSYKGILGFAFQDDRLAMSAYAITGAEQDNYEKLRIALKTVYGDEAEKDPNELLSIINKTTEEQISEHDLQRYSISKWEISY